jgi:hypothetical protein
MTTILVLALMAVAVAAGMTFSARFQQAMTLVMRWSLWVGLLALGFYGASVVAHVVR